MRSRCQSSGCRACCLFLCKQTFMEADITSHLTSCYCMQKEARRVKGMLLPACSLLGEGSKHQLSMTCFIRPVTPNVLPTWKVAPDFC